MRPPNRNRRLSILLGTGVSLLTGGFLIFSALGQNVSYFFTPLQIENGEADEQRRIRLGGLVSEGSVVRGNGTETTFKVTDGASEVRVRYMGILPDLFREGQGVIAQGEFDNSGVFNAVTILAKHDENYKPKELVEGLAAAKEYTLPVKDNVHPSQKSSTHLKRNSNTPQATAVAFTSTGVPGAGHVSKKYIARNCSVMTLEIDAPVTGGAFITYSDYPNKAFFALSHGIKGASLYNMSGQRLWHTTEKVDVISAFENSLLMYRDDGQSSELERVKVKLSGERGKLEKESPSPIAPTTLQRNSIASLGPVLFKDNGILFERSFVKLKARPTAIAATASSLGAAYSNGVVLIGLQNGDVQIWEMPAIHNGCS